MKKALILLAALSFVLACSRAEKKADMYEASEMSLMMREMVDFSKYAREQLKKGENVEVPQKFYHLKSQKASRNEHEDEGFQQMADIYMNALKGIERQDSQLYYYNSSIKACQSCHSTYCGGPLVVIDQLPLSIEEQPDVE